MNLGPPSILVVDDDDDVRNMICVVLSAEGYSTEGAADGVDALQRLHNGELPALIIVDLMMPRMDGDTLIRTLSAETPLAQIPVAIISGQVMPDAPAPGPQVIRSLTKPIELDDLLELVYQVAGEPADRR